MEFEVRIKDSNRKMKQLFFSTIEFRACEINIYHIN